VSLSSTERHCDLVVIGAGPAGCALALMAAKAGLHVILIEQQRCPKRRPGETLHPGVEPIFAQLGVRERVEAAGFQRHHGVWVEWDGPRAFQVYGVDERGVWEGVQAERSRLDALLLEAVHDAGAEVLRPCQAAEVLHDQGRIAGLATDAGLIRPTWVADGSGRLSWLARQLGLRSEQHSPPLRLRFGWTSDRCDDLEGQPLLEACHGGWDWHAPVRDGLVAWLKLRVPATDSTSHDDRNGTCAVAAAQAGVDISWRVFPDCAGAGYFLLGDAAAVLDPCSSHGVLRAMMSGIFASHLIEAMAHRVLGFPAAATAYRQWIYGQFIHDTIALRQLYARHPSRFVASAFGAHHH